MQRTLRREQDRDRDFARWVSGLRGAEAIAQCIHCGLCAGSCPLSAYMDRSPRQLMHLAREGFKDDVLRSFTIWLCTSCYECTVKCPREIKVTEVMYAFKRRAIEGNVYPKRFPIPVLAREFGKMVRHRGRITESRLVLNLMLKTSIARLFGMGSLGRGLIRTGRFAVRPETIRGRRQLDHLLDAVERGKEMTA